jgi:hypothetical protein
MSSRSACRTFLTRAASALAVILAGSAAPGQVRIEIEGGVVIEADQLAVGPAGPPLQPGPAAGVIGDPWWDRAAGERAAAAAEPPAPPQDRARLQAQARLAEVRRTRGMQILRLELSRVRAACPELDTASRGRLLAAGREAVEGQAAGRTPLVGGVEIALEQALRDHVGAAAAAAYRAELEARSARRQQAAIAVLVEAIDRDAVLDAGSRQRLAAVLRQAWRSDWEAVVATAGRRRIGEPSLPAGVADAAAGALDDETFAAWRKRIEEER